MLNIHFTDESFKVTVKEPAPEDEGCGWGIKLQIDNRIHEFDYAELRFIAKALNCYPSDIFVGADGFNIHLEGHNEYEEEMQEGLDMLKWIMFDSESRPDNEHCEDLLVRIKVSEAGLALRLMSAGGMIDMVQSRNMAVSWRGHCLKAHGQLEAAGVEPEWDIPAS